MRRVRLWSKGEAPILLVCRPGLGEFFLKERLVDDVIEVDKSSSESSQRARHNLRGLEWETILCPHQSWRTQHWLSKIRAKRGKVAFSSWRNAFSFEHRVKRRLQWPDALRQLSLLTVFDEDLAGHMKLLEVSGAQDNVLQNSKPVDFSARPLPHWASMTLRKNSGGNSKTVCLAPGSVWETKRWPGSGFVDVGRVLVTWGFEIVVVGSPGEKEYCSQVAAQIPGAKNLAGKNSVSETIDLFSSSRALVTNDSGAMHMAAVADLPTVAVFGPTTLELGYRPWQDRAVVVQSALPCRPCGKHGAHVCPLANHRCMWDVGSAQILAALDKYL